MSMIQFLKTNRYKSPDTIVYTTTDKLQTVALELGHVGIDVRTRHGHSAFALPLELQMLYKSGAVDSEWLLDSYRAFLEQSIIDKPRAWCQLIGLRSVAIFDEASPTAAVAPRMIFRHVLIDYLLSSNQQVYHGGEIFRKAYLEPERVLYHSLV